jgi:hypothetical protein
MRRGDDKLFIFSVNPVSPLLRYAAGMGLEVGGYTPKPDWPKLGPSLLIATALIVAIRTAKWPARRDDHASDRDPSTVSPIRPMVSVSCAHRGVSRCVGPGKCDRL